MRQMLFLSGVLAGFSAMAAAQGLDIPMPGSLRPYSLDETPAAGWAMESARDVVSGLMPRVVPLHTAPDDPAGGAYGLWAAGRDYKVSFHGDPTFVPYLGVEYPHNQSLQWTTESITVGTTALMNAGDTAERFEDAVRYEYRYPAVVEAYDVLAEGLEQTFVLSQRPAATGDFVVTGRLTTQLAVVEEFTAQHREIAFADQNGRELPNRFLKKQASRILSTSASVATNIPIAKPGIDRILAKRMATHPDSEWIAALRSESGAAGEQIVRELEGYLCRVLASTLRKKNLSAAELEDMAQEAFSLLLAHLDSFRGESSFPTWAAAVATRVAFTELRRQSARASRHVDFSEAKLDALAASSFAAGEGRLEDALTKESILDALTNAIDEVPTDKQRVATLALLRGVPTIEIAEQTQSNQNAVYKLVHDARLRSARLCYGRA